MKLELLCLTMPSRADYLRRLVTSLEPQLAGNPHVALRIRMCDPAYTLGENRDMMLRASSAAYVAHCDDDDLLSDAYVSTILPLLDGVDYIAHDLQCYIDGKPLPKVTHHTLKCGGWFENEEGYWRDISHINPMRRDLAMLEAFEGNNGEDQRWANRMRARRVVKNEHYVNKVLYHYFFRTRKNQAKPCPECESTSTVAVEAGSHCNCCGLDFDNHHPQKSCLWA